MPIRALMSAKMLLGSSGKFGPAVVFAGVDVGRNPGGRGRCQAQRDIEERNVLGLRAQAEGADAVGELEAVQNAADRAIGVAEQRDAQVVQVTPAGVLLIRSFISMAGDGGALRVAEHRDVISDPAAPGRSTLFRSPTPWLTESPKPKSGWLADADDRTKLLRRGQAGSCSRCSGTRAGWLRYSDSTLVEVILVGYRVTRCRP